MITKEHLNNLGIYELRALARQVGVISPTKFKREEIVKQILEIENGTRTPYFKKTKQGRPPKICNVQKTYCNCPAYSTMAYLFKILEEPLSEILKLISMYKNAIINLQQELFEVNKTNNEH